MKREESRCKEEPTSAHLCLASAPIGLAMTGTPQDPKDRSLSYQTHHRLCRLLLEMLPSLGLQAPVPAGRPPTSRASPHPGQHPAPGEPIQGPGFKCHWMPIASIFPSPPSPHPRTTGLCSLPPMEHLHRRLKEAPQTRDPATCSSVRCLHRTSVPSFQSLWPKAQGCPNSCLFPIFLSALTAKPIGAPLKSLHRLGPFLSSPLPPSLRHPGHSSLPLCSLLSLPLPCAPVSVSQTLGRSDENRF